MTSEQIKLVQNSFEKVRPIASVAADLFYNRLFEIAPEVRPLFTGDLEEQGRKLMTMLGMIVQGLNRLDRIGPAVEDMGRRHVGYGVEYGHYESVGAALLWTLEQGLGEDFTPEVEEAWTEAYGLLTTVMQGAAATVA